MQKMLFLILSCLYLVATSGMQVQQHYCMGHLKATTVGFHESKKCSTCGMEAGNSECCHDESQWLKVNDNHQAAVTTGSVPTPFVMDLPPVQHYFLQPTAQHVITAQVNNHSPPPLLPDRNVLFCVFRI